MESSASEIGFLDTGQDQIFVCVPQHDEDKDIEMYYTVQITNQSTNVLSTIKTSDLIKSIENGV
jgi:hypothetical protein